MASGPARRRRGAPNALDSAFLGAATEFDVPRDVLVAVGYGESRLDGHDGKPSQANGYGVMHLVSNPTQQSLERAARLTGEPVARLKTVTPANIRGGAAVLRELADAEGLTAADRSRVTAWYPVVARYGGAFSAPSMASAAGDGYGLRIVDRNENGGRLQYYRFATDAIQWDPAVNVLLPDGYHTSGRRYPVLYLLHGGNADFRTFHLQDDIINLTDGAPLWDEARVSADNPVQRIGSYHNKRIFLAAGTSPDPVNWFDTVNETQVLAGQREFRAALGQAGIPHEWREVPGGHYFRHELFVQDLAGMLGRLRRAG